MWKYLRNLSGGSWLGHMRLIDTYKGLNGGLFKISEVKIDRYDEEIDCLQLKYIRNQQNTNLRVLENERALEHCYNIKYDSTYQTLVASNDSDSFTVQIKVDGTLHLFHINKFLLLSNTNRLESSRPTIVFKPIPNYSFLSNELINPDFFNLNGLFSGVYGPHGHEILHISLHAPSSPHYLHHLSDHSDVVQQPNQQILQLHGLKITGDVNVPSTQLSFCINLHRLKDPLHEMDQNEKPVVVSLSSDSFNLLLLSQHKRSISYWAEGYGQINRDPSFWNPEWVPCSFIMWNMESVQNDPRSVGSPLLNFQFSVIWEDSPSQYRHGINFIKLI